MNILRSLATVSFFTMLSKLSGFIRSMLLTSFLGASVITDAFIVSLKIANVLRKIFAEGAFNSAFVPFFSKVYKINGEKKALSLACKTFSFLFYTTVIVSFFAIKFYDKVLFVFAPGFTGARLYEAIYLGRIAFPFIISACLVALMSSILNTFGKFALPASIQILVNLFSIAALLLAEYHLECDTVELVTQAMVVAGACQVAILWIKLYRMGFVLKLRLGIFSASLKKILINMTPSVAAVGVYELNSLIANQFLSMLGPKAISYVFYADQIQQLPFAVFGVALGSALLPAFTANINKKLFKMLNFNFNKTLIFSLGFAIPATISLFFISDMIVAFIYGRGKFTLDDVMAVSLILKITILSLPMQVFIKIAVSLFFADDDNRSPLKGAILNFITNFIVIAATAQSIGYVGIALGTLISSIVNAIFLFAKLKDYLFLLKIAKKIIFKQIFCSAALGAYCYSVSQLFGSFFNYSEINKISIVFLVVCSGLLLYTTLGVKVGFINLRKLKKEMIG